MAKKKQDKSALQCVSGANAILHRSLTEVKRLYSDDSAASANDNDVEPFHFETRIRHHCGEAGITASNLRVQPLLDPLLLELREQGSHSTDKNLLFAIMCVRYGKDLLRFPLEGNRTISRETADYARKICEEHPYNPKDIDYKNTFPQEAYADPICGNTDFWAEPDQPKKSTHEDFNNVFNRAFLSPTVHELFTSVYDEALYTAIKNQPRHVTWHPYADWHAALAIAKAVYDTRCSGTKGEIKDTATFILSSSEDVSTGTNKQFCKKENLGASSFWKTAARCVSKIKRKFKKEPLA